MTDEMFAKYAYAVLAILSLVPAIYFANRKEKQRLASNPNGHPYTWGYFFGYFTLITSVLIALLVPLNFILGEEIRPRDFFDGLFAFGAMLGLSVLGWLTSQRRRWPFLILSILTLSPMTIINGFYLKKRWAELVEESRQKKIESKSCSEDEERQSVPARGLLKIWSRSKKSICAAAVTVVLIACAFVLVHEYSPETHFERGRSAYPNKSAAISHYSRAIELDPEYAEAYYMRAWVRGELSQRYNKYGKVAPYEFGDALDIESDYDSAIELDPRYVRAYIGRGRLRKTQGDFDGAVSDFSKAIEIDPKYSHAYSSRARIYSEAARDLNENEYLDMAIADYTKAIEFDQSNQYLYSLRSYVRERRGDLDGAISDVTSAMEIDTGDPNDYERRGNLQMEKGDYDEAISDYTKSIWLRPNSASGYSNRAFAYSAKGDVAKAARDSRKALELDPNALVPDL